MKFINYCKGYINRQLTYNFNDISLKSRFELFHQQVNNILNYCILVLVKLDLVALTRLIDYHCGEVRQYFSLGWFFFSKVRMLSFYYLQGFFLLLFIDGWLLDDEPLWEPIEWSATQTWILFIFLFGWIAENLIVSRYGSYVGKDKRVWMSWYKTFWLIELYYIFNFFAVALFIIVPFYFEINYSVVYIYSWWHWYSRVFFFRFLFIFSIILYMGYIIQRYIKSWNWEKLFIIIILINIFLSYLLYTHFIMSFFGYLTDAVWYQKNRPIDYIQLSHEPSKWGWGLAKRDHFLQHRVSSVVWFKNDNPIGSAMLLFHLYLFLSLFFVYIYWIALFRRVYSTSEVPLTYATYCVSSLKQLFYCFIALYLFVFLSYIFQYWRLPIEFLSTLPNESWINNLISILFDYPCFFRNIFYPLIAQITNDAITFFTL